MKIKYSLLGVSSVLVMALTGCSAMPETPTAPSAAVGGTTTAAPDGSTLKVTSPAIIAPIDGVTVESRTPTLVWANSTGHYGSVGLAYTIEVSTPAAVVYTRTVGESLNTGSHKVELELTPGTVYSWRVRAVLGNLVGPWSIWANFMPPVPVVVAPPPTTASGPEPECLPDSRPTCRPASATAKHV